MRLSFGRTHADRGACDGESIGCHESLIAQPGRAGIQQRCRVICRSIPALPGWAMKDVELRAQSPCDHFRLVVTALALPLAMQWDWNQHLRFFKNQFHIRAFQQPIRQPLRQRPAMLVLGSMNRRFQRTFQHPKARNPIKRRQPAVETLRARRIRQRQRHRTLPAARPGLQILQFNQTIPTKTVVPFKPDPASHALARHPQIQNRTHQSTGIHRHNLSSDNQNKVPPKQFSCQRSARA